MAEPRHPRQIRQTSQSPVTRPPKPASLVRLLQTPNARTGGCEVVALFGGMMAPRCSAGSVGEPTVCRSMSAGAESTPRAPTTAPSLAALRPRPPLSGGTKWPRRRSDDAERTYYARARASGVCTSAAHHRRASVHTAGSPAGSGSNTDGLDPCSRCIPLFPLATQVGRPRQTHDFRPDGRLAGDAHATAGGRSQRGGGGCASRKQFLRDREQPVDRAGGRRRCLACC